MAIAFDAASSASKQYGWTISFSHTCSGSSRVLVVGSSEYDSPGATGVTYGGVAMTKITGDRVTAWILVAPASGTNTVVVTSGSGQNGVAGAVSFTGVDQINPRGTTATGTSSAVTTSAASDMVVDVFGAYATDGSLTMTVGAGQTQRVNGTRHDGGPVAGLGMSTEQGTNVTMSWTTSDNARAIIAIPLKEEVTTTNYAPSAATATGKSRTAQQAFIGTEVTDVIPLLTRMRNYKLNTRA